VTGRDDWRDVRAVVVVGRSLPPPSAVEAQAEALTGAPVARLPRGAWYPFVDATRELADGSLVAAEAVRHPDPVAEAFRWRACEGELVQIVERARGVNRQSDAERVDVLVLTDMPLPMPVETVIGADDIAPRAEDRMLVDGGVVLSDSEDGARAYPKLWRSGNALRVARHRERERHERDWQPPPGLIWVSYRRAANGTHHCTAVFDPGMVPDVTAWLRSALGDRAEVTPIAPLHSPIRGSSKGDVMKLPSEDAQALVPSWAIDEADAVRARAPARWPTICRVSTESSQRDFGS
jgi:putative DNA primase/helicase